MIKKVILAGLISATVAFSTSATARVSFSNIGPYIGVKAGSVTMSNAAYDEVTNAGIFGGYQLFSWFALEAEYTHNLNKGNIEFYAADGEYSLNTFAIYATFKTTRRVYYKGRIGLSSQLVEQKIEQKYFTLKDDPNVDYSGLSLSSGIGLNLPNSLALEAEATIMENDDNSAAMLTLGLKYKF